jgi:hypothetical protein
MWKYVYIRGFLQVMKTGKAPTRAANYIMTHTKKGGGYLNPLVEERVVCLKYICVFLYLRLILRLKDDRVYVMCRMR